MKKKIKLAVVLLSISAFAAFIVGDRHASAQTGKVETAGQKFKNIKVLSDIPADQLGRVMNIVSASLGVKCTFCHVGDDYEKDDKKEKNTAREMMRMTFELNQQHFNGRLEISCNTCHNGREHPVTLPKLDPEPEPPRPEQPKVKPTADQIIEKFISAVGGATRLAAIKTRYIKAIRIEPGGEVTEPEELWFEANKYALSTVYNDVTVSEGYNGSAAWKFSGPALIDLRPDESEQIKREAELFSPANLKAVYPRFEFRQVDLLDGHLVNVVFATSTGGVRERLMFDAQTGLLLRRTASSQTVLGNYVYQVDYSDYKLVGGVKIPMTVNYAMPAIRWTRKIVLVKNNVPVDHARFEKVM
jgi:photosynthetic reaction center cytochrome c subunit